MELSTEKLYLCDLDLASLEFLENISYSSGHKLGYEADWGPLGSWDDTRAVHLIYFLIISKLFEIMLLGLL